MAASDGTVLCVFSGSNCIIVDDFNQKVQTTIPIKTIWPELAAWDMDSSLDAVCRDDQIGQFIFFKGARCAIDNFKTKKWAHGQFTDYFVAPGLNHPNHLDNPTFERFCGSFEQPDELYLHQYSGGVLKYLNGTPADLTIGGKIPLGGPQGLQSTWPQMVLPYKEVGCTHIFSPTTLPGGIGQLTPAMLVDDTASNSAYLCTFINTTSFTPLEKIWNGWDSTWKVDAVTRLDASMIPTIIPNPNPSHHHHHHPHQGPGPVVSSNPLCNELPNIMKTVCSLTVLLHKAIDACYPQSSWPTQPYPDGCSNWGGHKHKHRGCGCK